MKPDRGLAALYNALKRPVGPHLDDETLALIVDAELAGESIEHNFGSDLAHIERCEQCAANYSELLLMMQGILSDMALMAESPDKITMIWERIRTGAAEWIQKTKTLRLTLDAPLAQLREPGPVYGDPGERPLTKQDIPSSPSLTLNARLIRQTPLTCRLSIQLESQERADLAGYEIQIRVGEDIRTAETNTNGTAVFDSLPIAALPTLQISITT